MKVILVCGGRRYADRGRLYWELDKVRSELRDVCIVQGGATGADRLALEWARHRGILCRSYHADWQQHGKQAGFIRNQEMLDKEDVHIVVAFPGGRGTADMVRRSRKKGVKVREITPMGDFR